MNNKLDNSERLVNHAHLHTLSISKERGAINDQAEFRVAQLNLIPDVLDVLPVKVWEKFR